MNAKMLTITAAAVAPTSNVVANCGSTGATSPKPSAIRNAAASITLMSRGQPGAAGAAPDGLGPRFARGWQGGGVASWCGVLASGAREGGIASG